MTSTARMTLIAAAVALLLGVINAASSGSSAPAASAQSQHSHGAHGRHLGRLRLAVAKTLSLPASRARVAAAPYGGGIIVSGGLGSDGNSTSTVYEVSPSGSSSTLASLPSAIHDAAAANIAGKVLVFGGGELEGSNRIVRVLPGSPQRVGTLPQSLSDLDAATVGSHAYVVGGWNGTTTNQAIYEAHADGMVAVVGTLPLGVRYPAVAALDGKVIIAGGETQATTPTTDAWIFDPVARKVQKLPRLPVATDHAAGAVLNGRFYIIGGERGGVFTNAILSWAPGEKRWRSAGRLPTALSDMGVAPYDGGIALIGGRGASGPVSTITVLGAR